MTQGTIVFVHGTGVRLRDYQRGFEHAKTVAATAGIPERFLECAWGDSLGVEFGGNCLPDPPSAEKTAEEEADFARWNWLFDDPLFELDKLTIRDPGATMPIPIPGHKPEWEILWERIASYQPTQELKLLLARGGLAEVWPDAWSGITQLSPLPRAAFEASAHELAEASHALARAVIAQLYSDAMDAGIPGPSRALRQSLFERLIVDWGQQVYGLGAFFAAILQRASTRVLRSHRERFTDWATLPVGDILLYQARGEQVRQFIRDKIEAAEPPVTLLAHSLGGIACVDLLALPDPPSVARLVTAGSQSPLLYEIGALCSLKPPQPLPESFPPWLNLYDRNDFLSYVAGRLWSVVQDVEIESGQPFPDSHSAYFGNDAAWRAIRGFRASMNDVFGFLVGIERYDQSGWNVDGPCANAIAIAKWLLSIKVPAGNIYLFLNPFHDYELVISDLEASGVQVSRCAHWNTIDTFWKTKLASSRPAGSRLLVYWSGHGFTENDGTRVFICSDYTADQLKSRVFNGSNFCRHLRSPDFGCFSEQVLLADVCAVYTGLDFETLKSPPKTLVPTSRQVAYFATPEGEYAKGEDGVGAFTRITLEVLRELGGWPELKALSNRMDNAFQQACQTPFRVDESDDQHSRQNRLVGAIPDDTGNALFQSLWSVLSPIDLPDTVYRPHFLRTVSALGIPELATAQGLSGMILELTSLCDTAGTAQASYGLLEFLVRLSGEAELRDAVHAWLKENAAGQQNALANAREQIRLESEEKILIVDVRNDVRGGVSSFEPSLRNQDLKPVPDIRLPPSPVTGWDAFKTQFPSVVETLRTTHDIWDLQIHFLVDPPLFDMPFHRIPIAGRTLGEEFVVLVRYRERLHHPSFTVRRCWCQYADALRGNRPSNVQVIPIPDPGNGPIELNTKEKGLCYSSFAVPLASRSISQKEALMRLLRLGAAYFCWSHDPPRDNDWTQVESCLTACLHAISTLDWFPTELKQMRLGGNAVAQQATLLWDDPAFNPFPKSRGTQIR